MSDDKTSSLRYFGAMLYNCGKLVVDETTFSVAGSEEVSWQDRQG